MSASIMAGALVFGIAGAASATMLDLTTAGASGSFGSAFFVQVPDQSTGTGIIDPFLRIQANDVEHGVNSDGPYTMDEKTGIFTRKMLVSDFGVVDLNGTPSIRFLLDINETSPGSLLSLDMFRIYVAPVATYNSLALLDANATKLYDMDTAGDNWIKLNYGLNPGSGAGDMFAYLPYATFSPHSTKYLYLYSRFGDNIGSDDGFEEWARVDIGGAPIDTVPEPTTLLLLGGGLLGGALSRRRKKA